MAVENKKVLTAHASYVKEGSWKMLLAGELTIRESTNYVKSLLEVTEKDYFCTYIVMSVADNLNSLRGKVVSHYEKHMPEYPMVCLLQEEDRLVIVLSLGHDFKSYESMEMAENRLASALVGLPDTIHVAIGPIGQGSKGLSLGYQVAKRHTKLRIVPDMKGILMSGILPEEDGQSQVPEIITKEESLNLSHCIRGGKTDEAIEMLRSYMT